MRNKNHFIFLLIGSAINFATATGQGKLEGNIDLGGNNVSDGLYIHLANTGSWENDHLGIEVAYQAGLMQTQDIFLNSFYGKVYGKFNIGTIPVMAGGEYLWTSFSKDLREINWIIFAGTNIKKLDLCIGNNSRIYRLGRKASENDETLDPSDRITEWGNFIYLARYSLRDRDKVWNIAGSITNYDKFLIQQETNPMFSLRFDYILSEALKLYSEVWYKNAGMLNARVNYFGVFIRTGIIWEVWKKD